MLITISRIHQHFHFLKPFRPALLLVLLAGLYALMNPRFLSRDFAPKTWSWKILTAMGVMGCLSVPFGISMGNSGLFIIQEYSKTILFAYLVILAIRNAGDLLTMCWSMAAAGGILAWLSISVFKMQRAGGTIVRIQNAYSYDSNDLGFVAVLCMVLAVYLWQVSGSKGRSITIVILAGLGAAVARTGSRGAFVALVVVGAAMLAMVKGISAGKKLGIVGLVGVGVLLAAPEGYWDQMRTILAPKQDYNWTSETGRKKVFERGVGYMMSHPLLGIGIENFERAEGLLSDRAKAWEMDQTMAGIKWSAAHNSFVQAGAELGIPGLVLFCTMVFGGIYQGRKLQRRMKGWDKGDAEQRVVYFASLYLPVAFIGFAIGGSFVSFAYLDPIYVLVALLGGVQLAYDSRIRKIGAHAPVPLAVAPGIRPTLRTRGDVGPTSRRLTGALAPPLRVPEPVRKA